jgi:hypothetical protein
MANSPDVLRQISYFWFPQKTCVCGDTRGGVMGASPTSNESVRADVYARRHRHSGCPGERQLLPVAGTTCAPWVTRD